MAIRPIDGDELLGITRLLDTDAVRQSKTASWLLDQVLHDIQAMPTIDPESLRPHGRWVCVNPAYGRYECSVCNSADEDCSDYYGAHNVNTQDFCPYCGAKMEGGHNP